MTTAAIDTDLLNELFDQQKKLDDIFNSMFDDDFFLDEKPSKSNQQQTNKNLSFNTTNNSLVQKNHGIAHTIIPVVIEIAIISYCIINFI
jgi:hypothetical protein